MPKEEGSTLAEKVDAITAVLDLLLDNSNLNTSLNARRYMDVLHKETKQ